MPEGYRRGPDRAGGAAAGARAAARRADGPGGGRGRRVVAVAAAVVVARSGRWPWRTRRSRWRPGWAWRSRWQRVVAVAARVGLAVVAAVQGGPAVAAPAVVAAVRRRRRAWGPGGPGSAVGPVLGGDSLMLSPKRVEFRKQHRGRMPGSRRAVEVQFGEYGLKALDRGWVTNRQIEAARIAMTRKIKRGGKVWINIFPDKPYTKKPAETRAGFGTARPKAGSPWSSRAA